jgi:DNA (cytosine-5)-methyltransferase 1
MKFTFIDLFCGIGGFHIALKNLGGECVFASDIDKDCREVYKINYGIEPKGDITKIDVNDIPNHDVLVGGFPCQAMSNAGHKKAFDDKRGKLFDEIIRIAREKQPKFMLLENVKHIKKVKDAMVYNYIYEKLCEIGYVVSDIELSPHQFGVPQNRPRIYFICIRKDLYDSSRHEYNFEPVKSKHIIFEDVNKIDKKYFVNEDLVKVIDAWNDIIAKFEIGQNISTPILIEEFDKDYSEEEMHRMAKWKQQYITKNKELYTKYKNIWNEWLKKYYCVLNKKKIYSKLEWQAGSLKEYASIWNQFIQIRQSGIRVKKTDYFPTLVAMVQVPIYGKEKRYLTPRECGRLQSFPDWFVLHKTDKVAYKQFGNSVNVVCVEFILKKLVETIL